MKAGGGFDGLLSKPSFKNSLSCLIFDEAHCISQWGSFRPAYKEVSRLYLQLPDARFVFASATFSPPILDDIKSTFGLVPGSYEHIWRSNDRPNLHLSVRKIVHPITSYIDLAFLIPDGWKDGDPPPPKFLIFFNSIAEATDAGQFLRRRLPPTCRDKIGWFHSEMSDD